MLPLPISSVPFSLRLPAAPVHRGLCAALCAALALLGGCADAPSMQEESKAAGFQVEMPQHWQKAGEAAPQPLDAAALAQWWTLFNDPVLDKLIGTALANSPDVRSALSRVQESRARRGVAIGSLLPSLSAGITGRGSRTRNHNTATTTNAERYGASLDASWEIDLFGKQQLAVDAATADWERSQETLYAAQVTLAAQVAEAYVSYRATQLQLDVLRRNIAAREQTTELTAWRYASGDVSKMEEQQALSTLEQARASVPTIRQNLEQGRNRLALLLGMVPGAVDEMLEPAHPLPAIPGSLAIGIPAEVLRQRPDIRSAEKTVEAAVYRSRASQRERLPSLNLSGSLGIEALKAGNLFSPDATIASLLGSLVAPLFQGGRITQNIAIQGEVRKQAVLAYETAVLTALSEVENALVAVEHTSARVQVLARAVAAANLAAELAAQRYEAGQADLLTVLEAQRTQLSLEEQQVTTSASLVSAHIQLYRALGGGWTPLKDADADADETAAEAETEPPATASVSTSTTVSTSTSVAASTSASTTATASAL